MRKIVGKRSEPISEDLRVAVALAETFISPSGPRPTKIQYDGSCSKCRAPVVIFLSEDTSTGEIWLKGPDKCDKCGNQLSNTRAKFQLSQEAIESLFGKF